MTVYDFGRGTGMQWPEVCEVRTSMPLSNLSNGCRRYFVQARAEMLRVEHIVLLLIIECVLRLHLERSEHTAVRLRVGRRGSGREGTAHDIRANEPESTMS